jgi:ABC-2 type transport system permease protein
LRDDSPGELRKLTVAGLVQLPGLLVLGGAVVAAVGLAPRWAAPVCRSLLFASLVLGPLFGTTLGMPQWVQNLSPFTHVPEVPAASVTVAPLLLLAGVWLALAVAGVVATRRRDLVLLA